jgi:hypothetical protein
MTKSNTPEWVKQELAKADEAFARGRLEQAAQPWAIASPYLMRLTSEQIEAIKQTVQKCLAQIRIAQSMRTICFVGLRRRPLTLAKLAIWPAFR